MKPKNLKKVLALILCCAMLGTLGMFMSGCKSSNGDWDYIQSKGTMIIGITDFPPMDYKDDSGNWIGFEADFANAVCAKLGVTAVFQEVMDWTAIATELSSKNVDAIWNGMTVTDDRAKNMDLSTHYMLNHQVLVTTSANVDKYQTADNLNGVTVDAEDGSTGADTMNSDPFFAQANKVPVDSQIKALMEVKAGTADVAVVDYLIAENAINAGGDYSDLVISPYKTFADEEYAVGFRKNSPNTLDKVNSAIADLKASGELQTIADKYGLGDLLIK
ncbi:MAG: transporter substrate-binding domain-containing protein [Oscillospiraceae bacterium]|nr:transporter substrate-binding domain-containing protein [Oscillospiraceae bacterium]